MGLGKGILDSLYLLIPLINTKSKKMKRWTHTTSSFLWVTPGTKRKNIRSSLFILSFVHGRSTKNYGHHWFISFICTRPFDQDIWSSLIYSFSCTRPFDQELRSSLIYSFYSNTTIQPIYMVLFCAWPFEQKLLSSFIYFFYLYTTIRSKCMVFIHLFLLFTHNHSTKIYGPLSFFLFLVHDHLTKN